MIVSADTLAAIRTDFQAIFLEAYAGFVARWQEIATEFPSTGEFLDLSWLGAHPAMKEWLDEKTYEGLRRHRYAITNKDWEATLEVMRKAIEDDSLGLYKPRIQEMAIEGKRHPDELVSALLTGGTAGLAFDGLAFFADTRAIGDSGNIDNLLAGTGVTQALFAADFVAAQAAMYGYLNDRGKPANPVLDLIAVVPPALKYVADQTFTAGQISSTDNVLKGAARVWANPYLTTTDANDWYLLNVFGPIKPLALSMRKTPGFFALDSMSSDHVFKKGSYLYSVEARYNGGYMLPWKATKTVNA